MSVTNDVNAEYATILEQMDVFNNYIANIKPDATPDEHQKELDRISNIVQESLGVIAGLLGVQQSDQDPPGAYSKGKGIGTLIGSGLTKIAATSGAVGAYVSKNIVYFYLGVTAAVACLALDCIVAPICLNCMAHTTDQKAEAIKTNHEVLQPLYNQAEQINLFFKRFTKLITSPELGKNEARLSNKAATCLQTYQSLPINLQKDHVYFRMLSLFISRLPSDHPIHQKFAEARFHGLNLSDQEAQLSMLFSNSGLNMQNSEQKMEKLDSDDEEIQREGVPENFALLQKKAEEHGEQYKAALKEIQGMIRDQFNLKPDRSIHFIEKFEPHGANLAGAEIIRLAHRGLVVNPQAPEPAVLEMDKDKKDK